MSLVLVIAVDSDSVETPVADAPPQSVEVGEMQGIGDHKSEHRRHIGMNHPAPLEQPAMRACGRRSPPRLHAPCGAYPSCR